MIFPQRLMYSLIGLSFFGYLVFIVCYSFNAPYAPDDAKIFLSQLYEYNQGIKSTVDYYLGVTLYPHPKLTSRTLSTVVEFLSGSVNFKTLQILGNLSWLFLALLFWKLNKPKDPIALLYLSFLFLIPFQNTFWTISITSLPFFYIWTILLFYFLLKKKFNAASTILFLAVFTSGQGFMLFVPLYIYKITCVIKQKKLDSNFITSSLLDFITLSLWYLIIFSTKENVMENIADTSNISITLLERLIYFSSFIVATATNVISEFLPSISNWTFLLGCIVLINFSWILYKSKRVFSINSLVAILILTMAGIASFTRLQTQGNFNVIPDRYLIHSTIFLSCYGLEFLRYYSSKTTIRIFLSLVIITTILRASTNYPAYSKIKKERLDRLRCILVDDPSKAFVKKKKFNYFNFINNSISEGQFVVPNQFNSLLVDQNGLNNPNSLSKKISWYSSNTKHAIQFVWFIEEDLGSNYLLELNHKSNSSKSYFEPMERKLATKYEKKSRRLKLDKEYMKFTVYISLKHDGKSYYKPAIIFNKISDNNSYKISLR